MTEVTPAPTPSETPAPTSTTTPSPTPSESFAIPEAYKDRGWTAKIKSPDDLWKQIDNLDKLAGKKVAVPDWEKADPKEIDEYIGNLRPKDKSAYQLPDEVPEGERDGWAGMLHEIGIPAYQANKLVPKFMEHIKAQAAKQYDRDDFFKQAEAKMGAGYKEVIGKAKIAVNGIIPKELAARIDAMPNEHHVAFYEGMKAIMDKFGAKESGAAAEGGESGASKVDKTEERTKIRAEISALEKRPHTIEEKMALNNKLAETYKG